MELFAIIRCVDYEFEEFMGVFSSLELVQKAIDIYKKSLDANEWKIKTVILDEIK